MLPVFVSVVFLLSMGVADGQRDEGCYTSGSVAGIVIATIVVVITGGGLLAFVCWYIWKRRKGMEEEEEQEEKKLCPPLTDKLANSAFDNPSYFRAPQDAEKGESRFCLDNGDVTSAIPQKASNGTQQKKSRPFSSLPFHAVFHPSSGKKQKTTMDDTYLSKHLERIEVPLRGHDFTGLGFNICGNMRDGIFVKDVLHRGPASESGKIKAGDKIIGVTVSFGAMVYEDALTILSYASPYDVKLELEKCPPTSSLVPSPSPKRLGASTSFRTSDQRRLFHPLYRSQSIDDLTQIGKDIFLNGNSPGVQKDSCTTPKRSQSIETGSSTLMKNRITVVAAGDPVGKSTASSRNSSTSSSEHKANPHEKAAVEESKEEASSSRFRVESAQSRSIPPVKPVRDSAEDQKEGGDEVTKGEARQAEDTAEKVAEGDAHKPTAPPRRMCTPKRKAPAPPPTTSAVVHRAEDDQPPDKTADTPSNEALLESKPDASESRDVDSSSIASSDRTEDSPEKRKASSLGDLTKLEAGGKKASVSPILERAVSLDLQQSMPGDETQKKRRGVLPGGVEDSDAADGLKRWDNGLDEVLTNGRLHDDEHQSVGEGETNECVTIEEETVDASTPPVRKVIQVCLEDALDDDVPYLASAEQADEDNKIAASSVFTPVTISIPVIKPDLTNFEKLPSPPPASTYPVLDSSWRKASSATDDTNRFGLDKISVQALYKPIFTSKEVPQADEGVTTITENLVNGNDSSELYSTAQETSVDNNSVSMTVSPTSTRMSSNVTIKTPNSVAGFAKTLIEQEDIENLLCLATEPPPPKPVENE